MQRGLDAVATTKPAGPATHSIYTPVWKPDGRKFRRWLPVGRAWCGDREEFCFRIDGVPINAEETATDYFQVVPVGAPPPEPLTVSREQFIEEQALARE
jgi:hypothetical protein